MPRGLRASRERWIAGEKPTIRTVEPGYLPVSRDSFALRCLSPAMVRIFLHGCSLHSYVGGMPLALCRRAGLIVDNLGVHL